MSDIRSKSPLNEAVGKLLVTLRAKKGWDEGKLAQALDVSKTYLHAIELGARYLPPYAAVGLVESLKANFFAVSGLLIVVNYLDVKTSDPRFYDLLEIERRAEELKKIVAPFESLLSWVIESAVLLRQGKQISSTHWERAERLMLEKLFETPSSEAKKAGRTEPKDQFMDAYGMSPVFEDLLDAVAARLSLFPPHMDVKSFTLWEGKNSDRIVSIRCYVDDIERLIKETDKFDWSSLKNNHKPVLRVLMREIVGIDVADAEVRFRNRLLRQLRERKIEGGGDPMDRVRIAGSGDFEKRCQAGLVQDIVSHRRAPAGEADELRKARINSGRYMQFNNAWIYEIRSDSPDPTNTRTNLVGFIGTYLEKDPGSSYVVVMDREDVAYWSKLLKQAWPS